MFCFMFHISVPIIHYFCNVTEAEGELGSRKTILTVPRGTSVVVPYCYLFLLSVFILWFSYYINDIFCKF